MTSTAVENGNFKLNVVGLCIGLPYIGGVHIVVVYTIGDLVGEYSIGESGGNCI